MDKKHKASPPTPLHKRGERSVSHYLFNHQKDFPDLVSPLLWRGVGGEALCFLSIFTSRNNLIKLFWRKIVDSQCLQLFGGG